MPHILISVLLFNSSYHWIWSLSIWVKCCLVWLKVTLFKMPVWSGNFRMQKAFQWPDLCSHRAPEQDQANPAARRHSGWAVPEESLPGHLGCHSHRLHHWRHKCRSPRDSDECQSERYSVPGRRCSEIGRWGLYNRVRSRKGGELETC